LIIDTHCHLDDKKYNDLEDVYKRAYENNVKGFIIPGADIKTLKRAVDISNTHNNTFFAVGVHPYDIDEYDREYLKKYITYPKCVAVGECGLDYYRLPKNEEEKLKVKKKQKEVFIDQIELAKEYKLPLIVHIREASQDSLEILKDYVDESLGGVLHCFNASAMLLELTEKNFYFGIGGVVTFKNAKKLVDIVKDIPLDKIVLETDAPYLTPHPFRGKRNEPAYTKYVLEKLSNLLNKPKEELEKQFYQNSLKLFNKVKVEV